MRGGRLEEAQVTGRVSVLVPVLAAAVAAGLLIWRLAAPPEEGAEGPPAEGAAEAAAPGAGALPRERAAPPAAPGPPASVRGPRAGAELAPAEVIDAGWRCGMARGSGSASDLAVVALGGADRFAPARFSVLGASGALLSGELDGYPFQIQVGKTPNGGVVAGFGGMSLPAVMGGWGGLHLSARPLRIYADGAVAYERPAVLLFGVADDGSSHFFIEPEGDVFSGARDEFRARLVVSSRRHGTEARHDLGASLQDAEGFLAYRASYAAGGREVHLEPLTVRIVDKGMGTHYFYAARGESPPREIRVNDRGRHDVAHFTSSEEAYFFHEASDGADALRIAKTRFTWGLSGGRPVLLEHEEAWRRAGPVNTRADGVAVSPDGAWLLFRTGTASNGRGSRPDDWGLYVLDTVTGETVFHLPTDDDPAVHIERLSSVLPTQPEEEDIGDFFGAFFAGNGKLVVRRFRYADKLHDFTLPVYDVYDLNAIAPDAQPEYRFEGNEHDRNQCASLGFPGGLRALEDGRLAYEPLQ